MDSIIVHEVGMRDGLQMEKEVVPTDQKIRWIDQLLSAGVDIIQVGSFVHPTKVPQMADTDDLFRHFNEVGRKPASVILSGLVLNERGLDRAMLCGVEMFCMGVSASDTHSRKNTGMSTVEAADRIIAMARQVVESQKRVQVCVQSAFGCGYEGAIPVNRVLQLVHRFLEAGLKNISLADTAGHATPEQVERLFGSVFKLDPAVECTCHFHNNYGLGLANCCAAMRSGVRYYESSVAGLGGCPFTKVAGGNVCTEDFVHYLRHSGRRYDINLDALVSVAQDMELFFGRQLPGMVYKAGVLAAATC